MAQRRVSSITWRQVASSEIEVGYDNGETESVEGTHADAARMAQTAGLVAVASPLGIVRWGPAPSEGGRRPPRRQHRPAVAAEADDADDGGQPRRGSGQGEAGEAPRPKRIGPWLSE